MDFSRSKKLPDIRSGGRAPLGVPATHLGNMAATPSPYAEKSEIKDVTLGKKGRSKGPKKSTSHSRFAKSIAATSRAFEKNKPLSPTKKPKTIAPEEVSVMLPLLQEGYSIPELTESLHRWQSEINTVTKLGQKMIKHQNTSLERLQKQSQDYREAEEKLRNKPMKPEHAVRLAVSALLDATQDLVAQWYDHHLTRGWRAWKKFSEDSKRFEVLKRSLEPAARVIQRNWKAFRDRNVAKVALTALMNDKRKRASIKIQSFFRAFVSRKSIWNLFEERRRQVQYEAATKCQSLIRAFLARCRVLHAALSELRLAVKHYGDGSLARAALQAQLFRQRHHWLIQQHTRVCLSHEPPPPPPQTTQQQEEEQGGGSGQGKKGKGKGKAKGNGNEEPTAAAAAAIEYPFEASAHKVLRKDLPPRWLPEEYKQWYDKDDSASKVLKAAHYALAEYDWNATLQSERLQVLLQMERMDRGTDGDYDYFAKGGRFASAQEASPPDMLAGYVYGSEGPSGGRHRAVFSRPDGKSAAEHAQQLARTTRSVAASKADQEVRRWYRRCRLEAQRRGPRWEDTLGKTRSFLRKAAVHEEQVKEEEEAKQKMEWEQKTAALKASASSRRRGRKVKFEEEKSIDWGALLWKRWNSVWRGVGKPPALPPWRAPPSEFDAAIQLGRAQDIAWRDDVYLLHLVEALRILGSGHILRLPCLRAASKLPVLSIEALLWKYFGWYCWGKGLQRRWKRYRSHIGGDKTMARRGQRRRSSLFHSLKRATTPSQEETPRETVSKESALQRSLSFVLQRKSGKHRVWSEGDEVTADNLWAALDEGQWQSLVLTVIGEKLLTCSKTGELMLLDCNKWWNWRLRVAKQATDPPTQLPQVLNPFLMKLMKVMELSRILRHGAAHRENYHRARRAMKHVAVEECKGLDMEEKSHLELQRMLRMNKRLAAQRKKEEEARRAAAAAKNAEALTAKKNSSEVSQAEKEQLKEVERRHQKRLQQQREEALKEERLRRAKAKKDLEWLEAVKLQKMKFLLQQRRRPYHLVGRYSLVSRKEAFLSQAREGASTKNVTSFVEATPSEDGAAPLTAPRRGSTIEAAVIKASSSSASTRPPPQGPRYNRYLQRLVLLEPTGVFQISPENAAEKVFRKDIVKFMLEAVPVGFTALNAPSRVEIELSLQALYQASRRAGLRFKGMLIRISRDAFEDAALKVISLYGRRGKAFVKDVLKPQKKKK